MVTAPAPELTVIPPDPMVKVLAAVEAPPARKLLEPLVLKVKDRAARLPLEWEMTLSDAAPAVVLKIRLSLPPGWLVGSVVPLIEVDQVL